MRVNETFQVFSKKYFTIIIEREEGTGFIPLISLISADLIFLLLEKSISSETFVIDYHKKLTGLIY